METNKTNFIPHHTVLDELQVAFLPIIQQLPIVQSMLKWANAISSEENPNQMGWMFANNGKWNTEDQTEAIFSLSYAFDQLSGPIRKTELHLAEFQSHEKIGSSLEKLLAAYKEIPTIKSEIKLLKEGHSLFENPEAITHLITYTKALTKLQERSSHLKDIVIREVIDHLSLSIHQSDHPA